MSDEANTYQFTCRGGVVFALCRCGKSFVARGSHGICRFMNAAIAKHRSVCPMKDDA